MEFKLEKKGLLAAAGILAVTVIALWVFLQADQKKEVTWTSSTTTVTATTQSSTAELQKIMVDIKGEVNKPGVYELKPDARVKEVVLLAGGLTKDAEEKQLNLAEKLTDQQMIYVPSKKEAKDMAPVATSPTTEKQADLVNINTADSQELQTLSGIGPAKAQAIIDYREENGAFKAIDDLKNISGFGEKTVEKLRESIRI